MWFAIQIIIDISDNFSSRWKEKKYMGCSDIYAMSIFLYRKLTQILCAKLVE